VDFFKDVIFSSRLADNPTGIIKGILIWKLIFPIVTIKPVVRYLDYDNNQLAGGQNIWSLKLTADYSSVKTLRLYSLWPFISKAVISTSFPLPTFAPDLRFVIILGIKL
jgi:hypothetical protein